MCGDEEAFQAELALRGEVARLVSRFAELLEELKRLQPALVRGISALMELEHEEALREERTARHGDLAGAGYSQRERIRTLEFAREGIAGAIASLEEALTSLRSS